MRDHRQTTNTHILRAPRRPPINVFSRNDKGQTVNQDLTPILERITTAFMALDHTWRVTYLSHQPGSLSDDAIFSKTLDGIILSWNSRAERLCEYRASEIIGQSVQRLVPVDRQQELQEFMCLLQAGKRIDHVEGQGLIFSFSLPLKRT